MVGGVVTSWVGVESPAVFLMVDLSESLINVEEVVVHSNKFESVNTVSVDINLVESSGDLSPGSVPLACVELLVGWVLLLLLSPLSPDASSGLSSGDESIAVQVAVLLDLLNVLDWELRVVEVTSHVLLSVVKLLGIDIPVGASVVVVFVHSSLSEMVVHLEGNISGVVEFGLIDISIGINN